MSKKLSGSSNSRKLFGHPMGLYVLFFTEMWERFSFYGMRFILVLFLTKNDLGGLGWSKGAALTTAGLYAMFVYLAGIPGGVVADRYIGKKRAVLIGGMFQCIGHFLLVFHSLATFFLGLGALVIGTGLLKTNISSLLGSLYEKGDPQKDRGFSVFYMGINMGSLLAGFVVTTVAETWGWHYGFSLAGIGMLLGILTYVSFQSYIPSPREENIPEGGIKTVSLAGLASFVLLSALFAIVHFAGYTSVLGAWIAGNNQLISNVIASLVGLALAGYIVSIISSAKSKIERDRVVAFAVSLFLVFIFFVGFEQAGGLMTLYTDKYTNTVLAGWSLPSSGVQNLNPIFVVLFSVWVSHILTRLKGYSKNLNATFQMSLGNIIMGLGFLFMIGACWERAQAPDPEVAQSSLLWLVGAYFFHTIGELCLSPVVLSFATNMAPKGAESLIMGIVFAVIGLSNHFAGQLGSLSSSYGHQTIFQIATAIPVVLGIVFMLFNKKVVALTHGGEEKRG